MHRALVQLALFRLRGSLRRTTRMLKSPRGALLLLVVLVVFGGMFLPEILSDERQQADPETGRNLAPLLILAGCVGSILTSASEKAVVFTMPEVEFLFAGPFTRRELLLYKLMGSAFGAAFTALIFSLVFRHYTAWWIAAYLGIWLALLFVQLLSMTVALVLQVIGERAYTLWRRLIVAAVLALAAVGAWQALSAEAGFDFSRLASNFRDTAGGRIVLAPFELFGRAIAAETLPEFAPWSAAAFALNLVLMAVVLLLDANYLEAAAAASQKRYEALLRVRTGRIAGVGGRRTAGWRLPQLPWLGGAGPVAWRQATQLARSSPRTLLTLFFIAIAAGPGMLTMRAQDADSSYWIIGAMAWATFLVTAIIPTGFRADLDYMDWFKTAPLSAFAIALGELLPPVLFVTVLQLALLGGAAAAGIAEPTTILLTVASFTLPVNLLFLTTENLLFLHYPMRNVASSPGDLQFMGRQMLMMFARVLILMAACGIAGAVIGIAAVAGISSRPLLTGIGWVVLMLEGIALIFSVSSAFRRFDPSLDMPG